MKTGKIIGIGLAILVVGVFSLMAQTADTTQQILHMRSFREGLICLGNQSPDEAENQALLLVLNHLNEPSWPAGLEQFLRDHPQSPWAASLHYDYASFCRRTGRTTKALEHFEAAWAFTKDDTSPQGQRLGGAVLANWADLLSSLGRSDQLKTLMAAGSQWHFVNPGDRDKFQGAMHSYELMQLHPGIAYRCGTFALKAVGQILQPTNQMLENLVELPSPTNGFSLAGLLNLSRQYGLNMVAVRRAEGQDLIVPSVIHWRQNHYAAILARTNDLYRVSDPTFGRERWMPAEVINEEASGEFLIPASSQTDGWTQLASSDAGTIRGMGLPNNVQDGKDKGCPKKCSSCQGMPSWWVTEPYINVWIADEPLSYLTSRGQPFNFQITYKQRDSRPSPTDGAMSNLGWDNSWASYIVLERDAPNLTPQLGFNSSATIYLANGGEVDFPLGQDYGQNYDPETRVLLLDQFQPSATSYGGDEGQYGLRAVYADGSQDIYGMNFPDGEVSGDLERTEFMLTRHIDANGDTTWFDYTFAGGVGPYLLTSVVDPDGRTNTLAYNSNNLLVAVTNAYGQSAHFKYDSSDNLTNLVDAQGLSSSLTYDTNGYPASLTTPYGTTTFSVFANFAVTSTNGDGNDGQLNIIDRAAQITDPVGANYLYLYRFGSADFMSATFPSDSIPANTPLGTLDTGAGSSTNAYAGVCMRNSFYWGPRQYLSLSTNNMNSFTTNDYLRGRMQHWLEDTNQLYLTEYLSAKQDPSPDGTTPGLLTFYDYQGKLPGYNCSAGTNPIPSVTAWRLPNGETHYEFQQFDYFGNLTNDITTYTTPNGALGTRTNQFVYAANTYTYTLGTWNGSSIVNSYSSSYSLVNLLTQMIGPDGNPVWSYGGFDTVTWTNFFLNGASTNGTTLTSFRVLPDYATNGLGQVATTTYSAGGGPVTYAGYVQTGTTFPGYSKATSTTTAAGLTTTNFYATNGFLSRTIDLQIGRTNSFGYTTDGLIGTLTNALGLNVSATWDNLLRLTSVQFPDGSYASNTYYNLDLSGVRDRLGNWTQYVYDGARHLINVTNANNAGTTLQWCGCGALTAIIDPLTNTTSFNYDLQGNLTNITYPDGSALNYQYNLAAWPVTISDGAGRALQLAYNNQGLVTNVTSAIGTLQSTLFDIRDRPINVTDANSITVTNSYDLINELIQRTWPDGIGENYGYNTAGLIAYTNRDSQPTHYGWDAARRLTSITNANSEVVRLAYDPANDITNLVDGLLHTTLWQYNQYGWLTNKIDGLGRTNFFYAHNPDGWVTNRWTPEKGNTGYTYDNVGNLKSINYPLSTINFAYDALNRRTNMVDALGTHYFSWTPTGRLATESDAWTTNALIYAQGLRTAMSIAQSGGNWTQSYGYDAGWRMTNTVSPAGAFAYNYQSSVLYSPSSIALPNGASIVNSYDSLARLTGTALQNHWGHILDGYTYTLDPLGLRTNIVRNFGLTTNSVIVSYDNIAQITSWIAKESNGTLRQNEQLSFAYDAAHNLHSRTNGSLSQSFVTDAANQLTNVVRTNAFTFIGSTPSPATNITVNGQAAQINADFTFAGTNLALVNGQNTFTNVAKFKAGAIITNTLTVSLPQSVALQFDNNGNLTNDGTRTFAYDSENQLTNVFVPGQWRSDFVYDGLNRRRIIRDYTMDGRGWLLTNEIHLIYDGYMLIQERDTNDNVLVTYTHGLDMAGSLQGAGGIGGLLARTDINGSTFYHADGNGNITALMDGSENIAARYLYNPYGRLLGQWGPLAGVNEMQFSSMPQHDGLSLYAFRAYEPNFQRWLNQDPIQERGGLNLYAYVGNNPVNNVDPLGLAPGYGNPISGPNGPVGPSPFGGAGYGIGFNGPDPEGPVEALYQGYNYALDQITPPINPNTDPYAYAASQTARGAAFAALMAIATDRLAPPKVKCPDSAPPVGRSGNPMNVPRGANTPDTIGGRDYSGHSLDEMQAEGIPPSVVENTIKNGTPSLGNTPGTTVYTDPGNGVMVVVNASGKVVTVSTKH